ncbi:MAG: ribosomal RNA small subunit methyltransferase A [Phycisphaeraceae bacterium]|nr:ribosomal RNA small subunit methyltransferase A [Phycisphaeraceae bacterium]MCW5762685.1 ribosomal RNA small subunit methyltransferase A [Phycisphaeraceae bacterium]
MQTASQIKAMLQARGLRPRKALGQNFLIDQNLIRKLVEASGAGAGDTVLEVGPGTGTLTEVLLERGCRVIACELDRDLCALLRERLGANPNFSLIEGDCLAGKRALSPHLEAALGDGPFSLVANLPYGAATPLLLILLTRRPACSAMHVTIQREVAQRLAAAPGTEAYGSISVIAAAAATIQTIATLPPECFWPRPGVESAMISIRRTNPEVVAGTIDLPHLADLCQTLFTQRRKYIRAACRNLDLTLPEGVDPTRRVCEMTLADFIALAQAAKI